MSTDGFAPFCRQKKTCWPLLIYNYNLPPEIRFHLEHILCVGVISGPSKPKDFDSFVWPLVQELLRLALGVQAFDITSHELFSLRAYLTLGFGDIPAVSMMMCMKGHNGVCPCRMCSICALRTPNSQNSIHYVPLDRSQHPVVKNNPSYLPSYAANNLPLRSHTEIITQANEVQFAPSQAAANRLAKKYGVKGIAILSVLPGISFPTSFPYDFMHLIFENVMKNLILLWTGNFKGLDTGSEDYELQPKVWEVVGAACAISGSTIPSAFGARPPNIADNRVAMTANSYSFWMQYLGPALLFCAFTKNKYYTHFIKFVRLIKLCLQFEITRDEINDLRLGFQQWVEGYEK